MNRTSLIAIVFVAAWLVRSALAQDPEWPLEIESGGSHIVLYQPQPDTFENDKLSARAAVSVQRAGEAEPTFGAVWLVARVSTDRDARTVTVLDVKVPDVKFPGATAAQEAALIKVIQDELPKEQYTFSLDRLLATLDRAVQPGVGTSDLQHAEPHILLAKDPTVLVIVDGAPKMQAIEGSSVMRVVNTPFVILFDLAHKTYWVHAGDAWVKSERIEGPWTNDARPPTEVVAAIPPRTPDSNVGVEPAKDARPVRVIVATEPTELIVTDGEPRWTPLRGTDLLYLSNSASDAFLDVDSQKTFVLLAGRWYTSASLEKGPWSYVAADDLPASFARIPADSEKSSVRTFVAGTDEARDSLLDAAIPQTSVVKRSDAHCVVTYDGEPRFEPIHGTSLRYAVNTGSSVIQLDGRFYCCSEAVWFVADSAFGPWIVCTQVPPSVYTIPASCPIYPVRYVYVYDSTPEVVYVGYLPGYVGCYAAGSTIVYGTGYWYPGWYGSAYYPRPHTWGFCPHYDPWTCGWSFGIGFGWDDDPGWFSFSFGWGHSGWWGPGGFGGHHFDIHDHVVGHHTEDEPPFGHHDGHGDHGDHGEASHVGRHNLYNRIENARRNHVLAEDRSGGGPAAARTRVPTKAPNDVYVDRDGRVLRRTKDGWEEHRPDGWKPDEPGKPSGPLPPRGDRPSNPPPPGHDSGRTPPAGNPPSRPPSGTPPPTGGQHPTPPSTARPSPGSARDDLDRMRDARQHGSDRANAVQRSREKPAAPPPSRPHN